VKHALAPRPEVRTATPAPAPDVAPAPAPEGAASIELPQRQERLHARARREPRRRAAAAAAVGVAAAAVITGVALGRGGTHAQPRASTSVADYVRALEPWKACISSHAVTVTGSRARGGRPVGRSATNPCGPRPAAPPDAHLQAYLTAVFQWQRCSAPVASVPAQVAASCGAPPDPRAAPYSLGATARQFGNADPADYPPVRARG
jgi:hypothetical protein